MNDTDEHSSEPGPLSVVPGMERAIYSRFFWEGTPEETSAIEEAVSSDLAMEFDVKEHNNENFTPEVEIGGVSGHPFCLPWEENNFWLGTREPLFIQSTIPAEAGLYWDTGASDPCSVKDLTFGLFHPDALEAEEDYVTLVYFDGVFDGLFSNSAAGDAEASEITWGIQILGEECDFSAWCVNLPGSIQGAEQSLIREQEPLSTGLALFPSCFEFRNPLYPVVPPHVHGVYGCLGIK